MFIGVCCRGSRERGAGSGEQETPRLPASCSPLPAPVFLRTNLQSRVHNCCRRSAGVSSRFRACNLKTESFQAGEAVRPLQRPSAAMKTLSVLALVALVASCHFDKLFSGGGETPFSHDPPAGVAFGPGPGPARAGQPLSPILVTVVDAAGTRVA